MMPEDKLTRAERIRLEALARVQGMSPITPQNADDILQMAERVERWIRAAREDA
jgi:hypothetical protein